MNQVANTIYARFRLKKLPPGRSVYGVFTREYQMNTLKSQVRIVMRPWMRHVIVTFSASSFPKLPRVQFVAATNYIGDLNGRTVRLQNVSSLKRSPAVELNNEKFTDMTFL